MSRRPSPAIVIALIALFVSLGGTTYAVTALPANSVGTKQLRKNAVKERQLASNAVITAKLADLSVTRSKLGLGAVTGDRVAPDSLGGGQIDESSLGTVPSARDAAQAVTAQRAATADHVDEAGHAARADKAAAADRATVADHATSADVADRAKALGAAVTTKPSATDSIPDGGINVLAARCDDGTVPVGGGFHVTDPPNDLFLLMESFPQGQLWFVTVYDNGGDGQPTEGQAYAVCLKAASG